VCIMKKAIVFTTFFIVSIIGSNSTANDWVDRFLCDMSYYEIDDSDLDHIPEISPLEPYPDEKFTDIPPPVSHSTISSSPPQKLHKKTKKKHNKHKSPKLCTLFYIKKENIFICTKCKKKCSTSDELFEHLKNKHGIDTSNKAALLKLIGIKRIKKFSPKTYKRKEAEYYHNDITKKYYCDIENCTHSYSHYPGLFEHLCIGHEIPREKKGPRKKNARKKKLYDDHVYNYNKKKYYCPHPNCNINPKFWSRLNTHLKNVHDVNTNDYNAILNFLEQYCKESSTPVQFTTQFEFTPEKHVKEPEKYKTDNSHPKYVLIQKRPRKKYKKHKKPELHTLFYNPNEEVFICTECEDEFDDSDKLFEHLYEEYDIDTTDKAALLELIGIKRVFDFSPKTYKRKKSDYYHNHVTEKYYCDIKKCTHSYSHYPSLFDHLETRHGIPRKKRNPCLELYDTYTHNGQKYECPHPKCSLKRKSIHKFSGHLKKHHNIDTKDYSDVLDFLKQFTTPD